MPIKDVGNGIQQFVPDAGGDPLEQVQKHMSLADMANRLQQAPVEAKIKQIDMALKGNELLMLDTTNAIKEQQLISAKAGEQREKIKFANEQILHLRDGFQQGYGVGNLMGERLGLKSVENKERGSVSIIPPKGEAYEIWPNGITDPVKLNEVIENRAAAWTKFSQPYKDVYSEYKNSKSLLSMGTGEADRSGIFSIAKMQDRGGRVTDGDYNSIIQSPNVSQSLKNMAARAMETEGPLFGPIGSPTRNSWIKVVDQRMKNEHELMVPQAEAFLKGRVLADRIDPRKVIMPVGDGKGEYDLTLDGLLGIKPEKKSVAGEPPQQPGIQPANQQQQQKRPSPQEAGAIPTGNAPAPAPPKALNDYTKAALGNLLAPKKKAGPRPAAPQQPDVVIQNGHSYRLNKATGKYE